MIDQSAAPSSPAWVNSPAWSLQAQEHEGRTLLVLTAGSDESYIVDEATPADVAREVLAAWQAQRLDQLLDDARCGAAARQIQRVGALIPARAMLAGQRYGWRWLGDPIPALTEAVHAQTGMAASSDAADVLLVVRSNASWQQALASYSLHDTPHLFIDVAYHHTVCIGPLVVPGQTACLACLGNRVAHRWGDLPLPAQPAAARPALLAALLTPLLTSRNGLLPFIEYSVSLDLQTLTSTRDRVFQLPWCPACGDQTATGKLELPWPSGLIRS